MQVFPTPSRPQAEQTEGLGMRSLKERSLRFMARFLLCRLLPHPMKSMIVILVTGRDRRIAGPPAAHAGGA
jgi:hypothetical protein